MLETRQVQGGVWVRKPDLWRINFHYNSLELITWLSGLVDVLEVVWLEEPGALSMVVRNRDRSGILFETGRLSAVKIKKFKTSEQALAVNTRLRRWRIP